MASLPRQQTVPASSRAAAAFDPSQLPLPPTTPAGPALSSLPLTSIVASGTSQHPGDVFNVPVTRSVSMGGVGAMTLEQLQPSNGRFGQQELLTPATRIIQGKGSASPVVPSRMAPIGQAKLQIVPSQKTSTALAKPRAVPAAPFRLTHWVISLTVKLSELSQTVAGALQASNVDYEYNEAKWKAKCYVYRACGHATFVLKMYTHVSEGGNEMFLVELQQRKGCQKLFNTTYGRMVCHLASRGVVPSACIAACRAQAQGALPDPATGVKAAAFNASAPKSLVDEGDPDEDEAELGAATSSSSSSASASASSAYADNAAIVEAFATLLTMLRSDFDDVATPGAQSIAALSISKRVRAALAARLLPLLAASASGAAGISLPSPSASSPTPASAPSPTASSPAEVQTLAAPVLHMMQALLDRACNGSGTASIESRTACALALANLAREPSCATALAHVAAVPRLLDAAGLVQPSAASAALRRECVRACAVVVASSPDNAAVAARMDVHKRASVLTKPPYKGFDLAFDRLVAAVVESTQPHVQPQTHQHPATPAAAPANASK